MKLYRLARFGFPFHPPFAARGDAFMRKLKHTAARQRNHRRGPVVGVVLDILATVLWPIGATYVTLKTHKNPNFTWRRGVLLWRLALTHNVQPVDFWLNRLWEPEKLSQIDNYIFWSENIAVLNALNQRAGLTANTPTPISDKALFADFCKDTDIPTVPIFFAQHPNDALPADLPTEDLFLKPATGRSGKRLQRWTYNPDGTYQKGDQVLNSRELARHIHAMARGNVTMLVQPALKSPPELSPHIGDAPIVLRIVTGRHPSGQTDLVDAMAVCPRAGSDRSQGGSFGLVDIATGKILENTPGIFPPDARDLSDLTIPNWTHAHTICQRAHAHLKNFAFIGWDVAITAQGPVLLEGNSGWGILHFQALRQSPMHSGVFADIARQYP